MIIKSYNPANNKLIGQMEKTSISAIEEAVTNSKLSFEQWSGLNLEERLSYVKKLLEKK